MVIRPASAQTTSSQPVAPTSLADSAETMKMPDPIRIPTTIIVESNGPSARTTSDFVDVGPATVVSPACAPSADDIRLRRLEPYL
jgi:hypothetical protein